MITDESGRKGDIVLYDKVTMSPFPSRVEALVALCNFGEAAGEAVPELVEFAMTVRDPADAPLSERTTMFAIWALAATGEKAVPELRRLLRSESVPREWRLRAASAALHMSRTMYKHRAAKMLVPDLIPLLEQEDRALMHVCLEALESM